MGEKTQQPAVTVIEKEMFVFRKLDGTERLHESDITRNGTDPLAVDIFGACVGRTLVRYEHVSPSTDARQALIDGLERAVVQVQADAQVTVNRLRDQISQLKSITHEPAPAE